MKKIFNAKTQRRKDAKVKKIKIENIYFLCAFAPPALKMILR